MDEALIMAAVDISGRPCLGYALDIPDGKVGDFDTELVKEFMLSFSRTLGAAIHLRQLSGENSHHIIEGAFKALAHAMKQAVAVDGRFADEIPSTKGTIN
jgi:imidazoleglycerol-phosphate dehydratase